MTEIKSLKSENFITCKLSYDSLLSSIKLFLHNFSKLSESEKAEYKSLTNYVKQLSKCTVQELNKPKKINKKIVSKPIEEVKEEVKEEVQEIKEEIQEIKEETKKVVRKVVPKNKSKVQPPATPPPPPPAVAA
jgi:phenylalanyl-tRNA synthetase alpha subunit